MSTHHSTEKVVAIPNLKEFFRESVSDALSKQKVSVEEHTAHYVVNLLTMFARSEDLYEKTASGMQLKPLALMLSDALEAPSSDHRNRYLQRLGDVALFISGCFADSLSVKLVDLDYYISMGGNAYGHLSHSMRGSVRGQAFRQVFQELAEKFQLLVDVLHEMSDATRGSSDKDILRLYEVWLKTGSRRTEDLLRRLGVHPINRTRSRRHH